MRKQLVPVIQDYKILLVDDEIGIIDSVGTVLRRNGYLYKGSTNPLEAVEMVRNEHFDLLVLDFLMHPIHGDKVVEQIRQFNKEIYILLLTGHKDLAPPLETIKKLDIQGYCEKSDSFDQLILLIESGSSQLPRCGPLPSSGTGSRRSCRLSPRSTNSSPSTPFWKRFLFKSCL